MKFSHEVLTNFGQWTRLHDITLNTNRILVKFPLAALFLSHLAYIVDLISLNSRTLNHGCSFNNFITLIQEVSDGGATFTRVVLFTGRLGMDSTPASRGVRH